MLRRSSALSMVTEGELSSVPEDSELRWSRELRGGIGSGIQAQALQGSQLPRSSQRRGPNRVYSISKGLEEFDEDSCELVGSGSNFFFNDNMIIMQDFAGHLPCCCRYKRAVSMIFSDGSGERPGAVASNALSCPPFEG